MGLDHTVQAVTVTWRRYLVVLSGEQRDQGNWAAESVGLGNLSLIPLPTQQDGGRKPWQGLLSTEHTRL